VYCTKCGTQNEDDALRCVQCGEVLRRPDMEPARVGVGPMAPKRPNYLPWAIAVTICCCLPGGIVSIVYAVQADSKAKAGDFAGADEAAKNAKTWLWVSFGVGFVIQLIGTVLYVLAAIGSK
jgi:hypothetical protein